MVTTERIASPASRHDRARTAAWADAGPAPERRWMPGSTLDGVTARVVQRIHNPRNRECGCAPDCWCRRTALGRAVKWWFPARFVGVHHKSRATPEWKRKRDRRSET